MSVTHPISAEILTAYAAGELPEAFDVVVATHISLSDEARVRLAAAEEIGGAVLDGLEAAPLAADSLAATLRMIAEPDSLPPKPAKTVCPVLPAPVADYVGGTLEDVKWRPLGMGAKQAVLKKSKDATMRLLYIPAGTKMPDHGHHGLEMTLVLQGAFIDGNERFARGDIEIADEDMEHTPMADVGEDCICLVASTAPLRFNGFIPRIVQPFLGI